MGHKRHGSVTPTATGSSWCSGHQVTPMGSPLPTLARRWPRSVSSRRTQKSLPAIPHSPRQNGLRRLGLASLTKPLISPSGYGRPSPISASIETDTFDNERSCRLIEELSFGASAWPSERAARLLDLRAGATAAHMVIDQTH